MASKKRKYREKISATSGGIPDIFDHPAFRSATPPDATLGGDDDGPASADDGTLLDDLDLEDVPAAEPRSA